MENGQKAVLLCRFRLVNAASLILALQAVHCGICVSYSQDTWRQTGAGTAICGRLGRDRGIAPGIFAMVTFFSGGAAAAAFFRTLKSPVMKYLSLVSGALVLGVLISLVVMANSDPFTTTLGVGGVERLVVYPVVLWIIALGGHFTSLPVNKAQS